MLKWGQHVYFSGSVYVLRIVYSIAFVYIVRLAA